MADIAPLTPLRYDLARLKGGLSSVLSPPYDVISPEERAALAERDPYNIVRLILPQGDGDAKYTRAAELLTAWRSEGVFLRDDQPAFYRYEQTFTPPGGGGALTRRGFLAAVRVVPFADRVVLPHERTLSGPKEDRLKLFRATHANLSPCFMLYRDPGGELDGPLGRGQRLADFDTPDGIHHVLSKVGDPAAVRAVVDGVAKTSLLIADGHHRYETALRYAGEVSERHPTAPGRAEHRFVLTFLVNGDDPNLVVFPTHRFVHSLTSFSYDDLLQRARDAFDVRELARGVEADAALRELSLARAGGPSVVVAAPDGRVALLTLRGDLDLARHPTLGQQPEVLRRTDVAVLHAGILEHILGITPQAQAAKTNLLYPQDARAALADLRAGKGNALFLMNATPVAEVRQVAEAGEVMPQKSTFFYPKVPTGLAVHTLDPSRVVA